jgi:hypothetical protein
MSFGSKNILLVLAGVMFFSGNTLFAGVPLVPVYGPGVDSANVAGPVLNPNAAIRDLREDFVRTWHVFADTQLDGILNPGDTRVGEFKNWWTPVSAATQHGYEIGAIPGPAPTAYAGDADYPSTPIDHQRNWSTNPLGGLPQQAGSIGFYMTYSHMDNADFNTEFYSDGTPHDTFLQRNGERNGYALGWLTGETTKHLGEFQNIDVAANVKMDIFVHNGRSRNEPDGSGVDDQHDFGSNQTATAVYYGDQTVVVAPKGNNDDSKYSTVSRSDPQVVQSNDMDLLAMQGDKLMLVADYRDEFVVDNSALGYTYGPASMGYVYDGFNKDKYLVDADANPLTGGTTAASLAQFNQVITSMDVREVNSYDTSANAGDNLGGAISAIHANMPAAPRTPQELMDAGATDGVGGLYFYEDSFFSRDGLSNDGAPLLRGSTDGGVIAGLSGFDDYSQYYPDGANPDSAKLLTEWGDQQVIRIDFDQATFDMLADSGISEVIFYDWGDPNATGQQTDPKALITINVDANQNLYFETGITLGASPDDIYFPENRIYIAQVEHAPEPASIMVLVAGASALLTRRRRRRK